MNQAERYLAKVIFQNRVYKYTRQQFQDFFVAIMTKADYRFQPVKAYGRIGDRKNDGFIRETGTYYQVFAPEDITKKYTVYEAVNKLENDFKELYDYWNNICPIKKFFFVINDKYKGLEPPIIEMVNQLNNDTDYAEVSIEPFIAKDLERIFDSLNESDKQDILGTIIPGEIVPSIEFAALDETVNYLISVELPDDYEDNLVVPDFGDKIIFNGLSAIVREQLIAGSYQEGVLKQYFNENPGLKEVLQKKFHALYEQSKKDIPETKENYADCRFFYIIEAACAKKTIPIRTCVLVLMAYYFSTCDIFEEPQ